jgi:hypothetical protein
MNNLRNEFEVYNLKNDENDLLWMFACGNYDYAGFQLNEKYSTIIKWFEDNHKKEVGDKLTEIHNLELGETFEEESYEDINEYLVEKLNEYINK